MDSIADLKTDVNELWQEFVMYVPTQFILLSAQGVEPELAVDLADDGLPICTDPPAVADDGEPAVIWLGMFDEVGW